MLRFCPARRSLVAAILLVVLTAISHRAYPAETKPAGRSAAKPRRVLYLTHSQAVKHPVLGLSEKILAELGEKTGAFEATCLAGYKQNWDKIDLSVITPEYLNQFDAIIFYTSGELPLREDQKKAIIDFVKNGKGFVGIHTAMETFRRKPELWPEYSEMIGSQFKSRSPGSNVPIVVTIDDPKHPITKMLPAEWRVADEIYQFAGSAPRDNFRGLLRVHADKLDEASRKANAMQKGRVYRVAWCHNYGKGRVFCTSLGHGEDVWKNQLYQEYLVAGIRWAMRDLPDETVPAKPGQSMWSDFQQGREAAKIVVTRAIVEPDGTLARALGSYRTDIGTYPGKLSDMLNKPTDGQKAKAWKGPYIKDAKLLKDPWGQELRYKVPGGHNPRSYDLWSIGADGEDGTKDDIGNWEQSGRPQRAR